MPNLVVLLVDDNSDLLITLRSFVERIPDVRVLWTRDFGRAAVWIEAEKRIDLLLANVWLRGDMSGLHVAELALLAHPRLAVVMMSSMARLDIKGLPPARTFIRKPFGAHELMRQFDEAFVQLHNEQR